MPICPPPSRCRRNRKGDDAPVRRRPFVLIATSLLGLTACQRAQPWDDPAWRPATAPQRIVAASVLATEVLLAIAPRERLAGVHVLAANSEYSLVAVEAQGLPLVGAEPEQLLAARPDLVICDPFTRPETLALLGAAGVPVVLTGNAGSFADIAANVRRLGVVCHLEPAAERLVTTMEGRLRALAVRASEVAAFSVLCIDGALHTHGRPSLFDAMVTAAGARNLAGERGTGPFRKLDVEAVLAWRPDVLVLAEALDPATPMPAWLRQFDGVSLLPCIQNGRIVGIPGSLLGTTSHHLVDAAHELQRRLLLWGRP
jgi:iron complex transport system substrate-binding protein